jgi:hypothetical protein
MTTLPLLYFSLTTVRTRNGIDCAAFKERSRKYYLFSNTLLWYEAFVIWEMDIDVSEETVVSIPLGIRVYSANRDGADLSTKQSAQNHAPKDGNLHIYLREIKSHGFNPSTSPSFIPSRFPHTACLHSTSVV